MSSEPDRDVEAIRTGSGETLAHLLFGLGARLHATIAEGWFALGGLSNWTVAGTVLFGAVVPWAALTLLAAKLGAATAVVTGAIFYWPFARGTIAASRAMARLDLDKRVAIGRREVALRMALDRIPIDKDTMQRFEVPSTEPDTTSASVFQRVALACVEGRYDPVALILALDLPKVRVGSMAIRKEQLQAIRLGILTTFIGLMVGLSEVPPLMQGLATDKTAAIGRLVQDMAAAFGGSVAGLCAAALLQVLANRTEHLETQLLKEIETTILRIQTYFYGAVTKAPLIRSIDALGRSLSSFNASFDEGRIQIDKAAEGVGLQIRAQDELMVSRLEGLSQGRDAFGELVESQRRAIASLEQALRQASERVAADIRAWAGSEVQAVAAAALASSVVMGQKALENHAEVVRSAFVRSGERNAQILAEHTRASLASTERSQRLMQWLFIGVSAVIAAACLCMCGVIIWVFVIR